ncbi:amidohydrolase family protein [Phytomonospora sp. NPDC050363]|uniref:amidohydrolase family protein n=1 Tax=Phytomonospora sp. NPDC050363 TaxID=3155642 RepID=UPI0033D09824
MIIDAHHHLWQYNKGYKWLDAEPGLAPLRRSYTVDDLVAVTGPAGVDKTVLVEAGLGKTGEVAEFLALAATSDTIAGVVGWADIRDPGIGRTLAEYRELPGADKLVGVREQLQSDSFPADCSTAEVVRGVQAVADAGLTFDLVLRVEQLPYAAKLAGAVEDTLFILDHLGKPQIGADGFAAWREAIAPLAEHPHVVAKVSGLVTEADWEKWTIADLRPYFECAVETFGPERLMWGSDWPVCTLAAEYKRVLDVTGELLDEFAPTERRRILGGTAAEVYGLEG